VIIWLQKSVHYVARRRQYTFVEDVTLESVRTATSTTAFVNGVQKWWRECPIQSRNGLSFLTMVIKLQTTNELERSVINLLIDRGRLGTAD